MSKDQKMEVNLSSQGSFPGQVSAQVPKASPKEWAKEKDFNTISSFDKFTWPNMLGFLDPKNEAVLKEIFADPTERFRFVQELEQLRPAPPPSLSAQAPVRPSSPAKLLWKCLGGEAFQEMPVKRFLETDHPYGAYYVASDVLAKVGSDTSEDNLANKFVIIRGDDSQPSPSLSDFPAPAPQPQTQGTGKVKWKPPRRLLHTSGKDWEYQPSEKTLKQLADTLPNQYHHWKGNTLEKQNSALFIFWSGPGTGKSRALDEFQNLCVSSVMDTELQNRLRNAYVFKVTFENGTKYQAQNWPGTIELGTRMLFQLTGQNRTWDAFSADETNRITPGEVIEALAKGESKTLQDTTVILLVDGIQELLDQKGDTSRLKQVLDSVASNINSGPPLCFAAIAGTFYEPVEKVLQLSPQLRVYLTLNALNGHKILAKYAGDPFIRILIDDMGGHGRALEALSEQLETANTELLQASAIMHRVMNQIGLRYPSLVNYATSIVPALISVLTRRPLLKTDPIPGIHPPMTVETLLSLGLFRWIPSVEKGFLECPFVIIWLLSTWSGDKSLAHFRLDNYDEIQNLNSRPDLPLGLQCWQHWEETTAYFRMLKSSLLDGQTVSLGELHSGALLSKKAKKVMVKVVRLEEKVIASEQYSTAAKDRADLIQHELGTINVTDCKHFIINGGSASAADGFCGIQLVDKGIARELHQNKHIKADVDVQLFDSERKKAAQANDFFILYTTHDSTVEEKDLKCSSGLVCQGNFQDYFGPFSARAFRPYKPAINTATRSQLTAISGIGKATAEAIIEQRAIMPFKNREDAVHRVLGKRTYSAFLSYPDDSS